MSRKSINAVLPALAFGLGALVNSAASAATVPVGALLGASCAACPHERP